MIFTSSEFCERLKAVAELPTIYLQGGLGVPMTSAQKRYYTAVDKMHPYNLSAARKAAINQAPSNSFGFDCVCFVKAVLWGFVGDLYQERGGAVYQANDIPDTTIEILFNDFCEGQSDDFSDMVPGEFLVSGDYHCGVFLGDGMVIQANKTSYHDGVYIEEFAPENWTGHGKLCCIDYPEKAAVGRFICPCCGAELEVIACRK